MTDKKDLEENLAFTPKYDDEGLIPCITSDTDTGKVLMFAFMNEEAVRKTIETGEAHYWSRSRKELWYKGASSGHTQKVIEMRTDCDQDCIWIKVEAGPACHTGRETCFYRKIELGEASDDAKMHFIDAEKVFDPKDVY
ncbi:MAG: phosphoribosyl-AMP cyclohydrolase [Alphaproteobacteria bacterium]|nr:phosphoribosyl-AMP cyclohydrolase [Alphaproteobacteria bacterium]